MARSFRTLLSALVCLLFLNSCSPETMYSKMAELSSGSWASDDVVDFSVEITDTLAYHDFYMHARNGRDYPFSNLYVFVKVISPTKSTVGDTIEMVLANPAGKWLGHRPWYAMEKEWESTILFKRNIRFPKAGTYHFEMEQGMRDEQLVDLRSVGISIVKTL